MNCRSGLGCTEREQTDERVMPWRTSVLDLQPAVKIMACVLTRAMAVLNWGMLMDMDLQIGWRIDNREKNALSKTQFSFFQKLNTVKRN